MFLLLAILLPADIDGAVTVKHGHRLWEPQENRRRDFTGSVDKWICVRLNCIAGWIVLELNPTHLVPGS